MSESVDRRYFKAKFFNTIRRKAVVLEAWRERLLRVMGVNSAERRVNFRKGDVLSGSTSEGN